MTTASGHFDKNLTVHIYAVHKTIRKTVALTAQITLHFSYKCFFKNALHDCVSP